MKKEILIVLLLSLATGVMGQARGDYRVEEAQAPDGKTIVFRFMGDDDTFYIPWQGNGDKLEELVATVEHYKSRITSGDVTIGRHGGGLYRLLPLCGRYNAG